MIGTAFMGMVFAQSMDAYALRCGTGDIVAEIHAAVPPAPSRKSRLSTLKFSLNNNVLVTIFSNFCPNFL